MIIRKIFYGFTSRILLVLFVFFIPLLSNLRQVNEFGNSLLAYYIFVFGGLRIGGEIDIVSILTGIIPSFSMIYAFSNVMRQDCAINYIYVFTRLGRKRRWFFQRVLQLYLQILLTFLILFLFTFLIGSFFHLRPSPNTIALMQLYCNLIFCNVGTIFLFVLLQNLLSLWHGSTQSFLITALFYSASIIIACLLYNKNFIGNVILFFLPSSSQMYIWHIDSSVPQIINTLYPNPLKGFRLADSGLILCLQLFIVGAVGHWVFQKRDLAEMIQEE